MIKAFIIFCFLIVQFFGFLIFANAETNILRYALCKSNVAQTRVVGHDNNFSVIINLSQSSVEEFKNITAKNVGKRLTIVIDDAIITSAIIESEIDSGVIASSQMTETDAKNLQQRILNASEKPCGLVIQQSGP